MGLHPSLLRSLTLQGYRIPTPIQRSSIPSLLASPPRDLVGMARTGSGKTLAYMIPLVQRLGGRHSTTFGARALILTPTRELALQVLRVGKELARGWSDEGAHAGDQTGSDSTKGQSLRWGMIVGGEGLDEQFEMITNNPDVIIATPGRLLHLIVEMNLDLRSVQYVVFDEADRLFEMGFETALNEIIHRLPASRQTLLFSATLPKSLVEFAKAGLQDPKLVRLDAESKISSDLKMAFFSVKQAEKDACLLALLRDVIHVPLGSEMPQDDKDDTSGGKFRKGKGKQRATQVTTAPHQTLIFAATKHHVEYLANLLSSAGYAVSHIYGALDQAARQFQMEQFRRGHTSLLVVTDVAARGIDIPVLENVVNYDFPHGARVFVHRVGRTARAGRQGWAWSFVTHTELPYLLDLQLFLGRPLSGEVPSDSGDEAYTESLIFGPFGREEIDEDVEYVRQLDEAYHQLPTLRDVMKRGHMMYERSKGKASQASYKRAKEMSKDHQWSLAGATEASVHPILVQRGWRSAKGSDVEQARSKLMQVVNSFTPSETVFEVGHKGKGTTVTSALMKERRKALQKAVERAVPSTSTAVVEDTSELVEKAKGISLDMADEDEIEAVFGTSKKGGKDNFRDEEFYMSHYQKDSATDKGYALTDGASFVEQARGATFDLTGDDGVAGRQRHQVKWDKKKKRFVKGDGVGADNVKMVKTESGVKLPATYRSGRFEEWKAKSKVSLPKIGEAEQDRRPGTGSRKFRHNKVTEAKPLDQLRSDYDRKVRQSKKAEEANDGPTKPTSKRGSTNGPKGAKGKTRHGGKPMGRVKNEIKTVDQIRKQRKATEQRKAKNARTTRKGRR
ncbi:ATP-dependent RNA helicase DBP10 [Coniophora puteana RWD-64-598 SS2]|uniref:RNA helicase n=1 Tax=Coniophora puteana (strain RWD-64-598) TaxID=741705 RepID=A0A5M3MVC8_CONPW|nr:ATP-dependent RNA helicase DBP10 [Coniophora puteana RWD-64-598 SS2]EIW83083.1 ATP-dependent RNA helicase DBP10 [Coniophora puteana RWD-64-598 SS2]